MFSSVKSFGLSGMNCYEVVVETDLSGGIPAFDIVGLPDAAVKESRERVRAAIKNCGYRFPIGRITVNLAPADIKKNGPIYDLAIMLGILFASNQINKDNAPTFEIELQDETIGLLDLLANVKFVQSKGEARRLIEQKGLSVDGETITDATITINK